MAKILVDFLETNLPMNDDLIVYNKGHKKWVVVSKRHYLKDFIAQINEQDKKIELLEKKVNDLEQHIQTMAETMKEGIL